MDDMQLAEQCARFDAQVEKAKGWITANRGMVQGEYDGLHAELRRAGRFFRRCRTAAERKMCAGVFGPSQAGKSYLISALARDTSGSLWADFGGAAHDFIGEINPEGGKESTGLVTRFTMTRPAALPEGFPVQIRLLTELDLVKVLTNTYYADCEHREAPDGKAISAALDVLQGRMGKGGGASLDDLEELQEYLKRDFQAKPRVQELNRSFWARALDMGTKLDVEGRVRLYSLIWDGVEEFTDLLRLLVGALEQLGHPDIAFAPIAALIPRMGSIIDVAMLEGLGANGGATPLEIVTADGKRAVLPRSVVTALTAELTIVMQKKPDDYFEHTDLLDFPGYRSRYKFDDLRKELRKPDMLKELFLRGKVAYLFQRYSAERELTSMLLCIGPSNQEVQDLPGVINNWINLTHGEKPESRRDKPVALFFVLSKFDMEFEQKKGAPSVESRWDNRLHASMLDFFGKQYDWPRNWDGSRGFNNMFLLRNPNFRFDAVLDITPEGVERGVRPEQAANVADLEKAFLGSKLVAEHFSHPRESWDAAMLLNDGGIGLIREKLRPLCSPDIKRGQIETSLRENLERLTARLKPFWQTDDKEEKRKQKTLFAVHLLRDILGRMAEPSYLGELANSLRVADQDLYDLYFDVRAAMARAQEDERATEPIMGGDVDMDNLLGDLFSDDVTAPPPVAKTPDETPDKQAAGVVRFKDEAAYFASVIEGHWLAGLHQLADNPALQQRYGFPAADFSAFVSELSLGSVRLGLRQNMEEALRQAAAYADIDIERRVWKQASQAAAMINAYVDFLGYNPRVVGEAGRTIQGRDKPIVLFTPADPVGDYPLLAATRAGTASPWKTDWMRAVTACIAANVDFDGQQIVNVEQNRLLGDIIKVFDQGVGA
ncbi:MAG: putative virulence factor [Deltaproteobacteria bacterium]|jgi:hypothetical protein|nr:putative virulence factor [Deltaproteobacteria bacterium]